MCVPILSFGLLSTSFASFAASPLSMVTFQEITFAFEYIGWLCTVPQRVTCDGCGAVLYEGAEVKSPFEIIASCDGKCVKCGRKLSSTPMRVDVKILELKIDSGSQDSPRRAPIPTQRWL